jgi:hypothetical protein
VSILDQIARGPGIGRDLPAIFEAQERRSRYDELRAQQQADRVREHSRQDKVDKSAADRAASEQFYIEAQYALQDPVAALAEKPEVADAIRKQGQDPNDPNVAKAYFESVMRKHGPIAGIGPAEPKSSGQPVRVNRGGKAIYATPEDAIGEEAFSEAPRNDVSTTIVTRPVPGKPGYVQDFARDPKSGRRVPEGEPYLDDKDGGKDDGLDASLQNSIYRQAAGLFDSQINPTTGEISILENDRPRVQATASRASELVADGTSVAAAVRQAFDEQPWNTKLPSRATFQSSFTAQPPLGTRKPAPAAAKPKAAPAVPQIREGARARNPATGEMIELRGGQWVPVTGAQ